MSKNSELVIHGEHYITSAFGGRIHPITGVYTGHLGVDYGTHGKKIPCYSLDDGIVRIAKYGNGTGNYVFVEHPKLGIVSDYQHLDSFSVKAGQTVKKGQQIGIIGTTGDSTGIHLHIGIFPISDLNKGWYDKKWMDFEAYVIPSGELKSIDEIAKEVIDGKWKNYPERKTLLEAAGYNYSEVQKRVNEMLAEDKPVVKPKIGDKVIINGQLYTSSTGDKKGKVVSNIITYITRYKENTKHPYNTTGDLGWMNESDVKLYTDNNEFKLGDNVVPIQLVDYKGVKLRQYDDSYYITSLKDNIATLSAKRSGKYYVWAALFIDNIKKV